MAVQPKEWIVVYYNVQINKCLTIIWLHTVYLINIESRKCLQHAYVQKLIYKKKEGIYFL